LNQELLIGTLFKKVILQYILGETPEEIESNAKYVISVARRLGATVFIIWE
jgi:hypothetical protein